MQAPAAGPPPGPLSRPRHHWRRVARSHRRWLRAFFASARFNTGVVVVVLFDLVCSVAELALVLAFCAETGEQVGPGQGRG